MFRRRDRREDDATRTGDSAELEGVVEELDDVELERDENELAEDMTADLESQARDYFADNDEWMYGPNAEAVLEILDRLEEIVPSEARPLAETWLAIPKSDRDRARKAARKIAAADLDIDRYLQLAHEAVSTWMSVSATFPDFVAADTEWARICGQAGEAALDAATAVILEGKVAEIHYEALLEPWSETMAELESAAEAAALEGPADDELDEDEEDEAEEGEGAYGPNSDVVTDFLTRLWLVTPEQVQRLVSGWRDVDRDGLKTAHEALREIVGDDASCREQVRAAQEKLVPWLNGGRVEEASGFFGQSGQGDSRKMAGPALADAVAALVLGDLLDPSDAETLYAPWYNLMGAPQLPEPLPVEEAKAAPKAAKPAPKAKAPAKATPPAKAPAKPAAKKASRPAPKK